MGLSNIYSVGINNVGSYQVSGRPYTKSDTQAGSKSTITFPNVTKQIVFLNRGSNDMFVFFHEDSTTAQKFKIATGEQHTFNVKCKQIYTEGTNGEAYSLYASLTHIPAARMFALTGSGITE